MKTNWQHFITYAKAYKHYFKLPKIYEVQREQNDSLRDYPESVAVYERPLNTIFIIPEYNILAVRLHEYGHWINACIYIILDIAWEMIWWGLSIRKLFIKERRRK